MSSIACLKQIILNKWEYHYILVNPQKIHSKEQAAVLLADNDLQAAFQKREQSGSDNAVGEYLRDKGYINVTGFKVAGSGSELDYRESGQASGRKRRRSARGGNLA